MKITSALLAIFSLSACGGGGTENTTNAVAEDTTTETAPTRVGDLKVSSGFNFVGGETLTIKVTHSGSPRQRLYLNICSDFTRVGGQYQVNYATCPLRTSIQDGYKEFEIALSSSEQQLLAQVWPLTAASSPENHLWHRSENGNNWQITVF